MVLGACCPPLSLRSLQVTRAVVAAGGAIGNGTRFGNIIVAYALDPGFADRVGTAGKFHIDQQMMDAVGRLGGRLYTATNEQFERRRRP